MNKVVLIGRLTKDIELRVSTNNKVAVFTLAVNRDFKNQEGKYDADFINCVLWNKQADSLAKYCKKGSQIAVTGRIQNRSYDAQDGTKRYVTEVIVDNVQFLDTKPKEEQEDLEGMSNTQIVQKVMTDTEDPFKDFSNEIELTDDDLPF